MMNNTMTLEQKILNRIKTSGVKPKTRIYFAIRNTSKWIVIAISFLALGVSSAMIIFFTDSTDSSIISKLELNFVEKIFSSVPVLWIIIAGILVTAGYFSIRNTRRGYKISNKNIVLLTVIIATILGTAIYASNISEYVDSVAAKNIPLYNNIAPINTATWFDPEHGLLSGTVRERDSNASFTMRDRDAEIWDITAKDGDESNIKMPDGYQFHVGDRVKMIGKQTGQFTFEVREIYPWID